MVVLACNTNGYWSSMNRSSSLLFLAGFLQLLFHASRGQLQPQKSPRLKPWRRKFAEDWIHPWKLAWYLSIPSSNGAKSGGVISKHSLIRGSHQSGTSYIVRQIIIRKINHLLNHHVDEKSTLLLKHPIPPPKIVTNLLRNTADIVQQRQYIRGRYRFNTRQQQHPTQIKSLS